MGIITNLLKNMHLHDQQRRKEIVRKHGSRLVDAKDKTPFFVFKGEVDEKIRIVNFLVAQNILQEPNDFYYAALIVINSEREENVILAYKLIKRYRELGGKGSWHVGEKFFAKQNWGQTREDFFNKIKKEIGVDPSTLEN